MNKQIKHYFITQYGANETVTFAADELKKYIRRIDPESSVSVLMTSGNSSLPGKGILLGVGLSAMGRTLPEVADPQMDDAILIDVANAAGVISGANPRALLIAMYRFLREIGCRFAFPSDAGEILPKPDALKSTVMICETPSYRHRGICIEGTNSYQNITDLIEWLPKQGMNSYFTQFLSSYGFTKKLYTNNHAAISPEEGLMMTSRYEMEIKKRSLIYHKVGHGWTCEPYGVSLDNWNETHPHLPEDYRSVLSMLGGTRRMFSWDKGIGSPGNTNLCYSRPDVRDRINDAICDYAQQHPEVDYLHYWLADGMDNQCECEACSKQRPSDWYLTMLNELDLKMTARKIKTKIVFLVYVDLMWAPQNNHIVKEDRFTLMYAPITRVFHQSFAEHDGETRLPDYQRNHLQFPISIEANLKHLKEWKQVFQGDAFDYDYHGVSPIYSDPGFHTLARVLCQDMRELKSLGLNGNISCQLQRIFFPSGLLMEVLTRTLWNRDSNFDTLESEYYRDLYGKDGSKLRDYLAELSANYDLGFMRNEYHPADCEQQLARLSKIPSVVDAFRPVITRNIHLFEQDQVRKHLWQVIDYHTTTTLLLTKISTLTMQGDPDSAKAQLETLKSFVAVIAPDTQNELDAERILSAASGLITRDIPKILGSKEKMKHSSASSN